MTVPSSSNRMEYTGNGVASIFDYTFQIFSNTDLQVYVLDTDGVQTSLVLSTDFTVSGAGDPDGGSITLTAGALTTGYELVILREVPLTQEVDLRNQGAYYPETVETMGDRLMMGIQQIAERVSRTLQFRASDNRTTPPRTNLLPAPQTGSALSWNADGNLENVQLASINHDIIITGGDAGKVIKVNATDNGIDVGAIYTDANTAGAIIQRDVNGRAKVSNPSDAQDIATKDYVDTSDVMQWIQAGIQGSGLTITSTAIPALAAMAPTRVAFFDSIVAELRAYDWNGSSWVLVGSGLAIASPGAPALAAISSTQVALIGSTLAELRTYTFDGTNWALTGAGLALGTIGNPGLAALSSTEVAVTDNTTGEIRTYRWNGSSAWSQVGNALPIVGASGGTLALTAISSTSVAMYSQTTGLEKYDWDGTDWDQDGSELPFNEGVGALAALSGIDVAFLGSTGDKLQIYRWSGTEWAANGSPLSFSAGNPALAALNGTDVAFIDGENDQLRIYRFAFYMGDGPYRPS